MLGTSELSKRFTRALTIVRADEFYTNPSLDQIESVVSVLAEMQQAASKLYADVLLRSRVNSFFVMLKCFISSVGDQKTLSQLADQVRNPISRIMRELSGTTIPDLTEALPFFKGVVTKSMDKAYRYARETVGLDDKDLHADCLQASRYSNLVIWGRHDFNYMVDTLIKQVWQQISIMDQNIYWESVVEEEKDGSRSLKYLFSSKLVRQDFAESYVKIIANAILGIDPKHVQIRQATDGFHLVISMEAVVTKLQDFERCVQVVEQRTSHQWNFGGTIEPMSDEGYFIGKFGEMSAAELYVEQVSKVLGVDVRAVDLQRDLHDKAICIEVKKKAMQVVMQDPELYEQLLLKATGKKWQYIVPFDFDTPCTQMNSVFPIQAQAKVDAVVAKLRVIDGINNITTTQNAGGIWVAFSYEGLLKKLQQGADAKVSAASSSASSQPSKDTSSSSAVAAKSDGVAASAGLAKSAAVPAEKYIPSALSPKEALQFLIKFGLLVEQFFSFESTHFSDKHNIYFNHLIGLFEKVKQHPELKSLELYSAIEAFMEYGNWGDRVRLSTSTFMRRLQEKVKKIVEIVEIAEKAASINGKAVGVLSVNAQKLFTELKKINVVYKELMLKPIQEPVQFLIKIKGQYYSLPSAEAKTSSLSSSSAANSKASDSSAKKAEPVVLTSEQLKTQLIAQLNRVTKLVLPQADNPWEYSEGKKTAFLHCADGTILKTIAEHFKSNGFSIRLGRNGITKQPLLYVMEPALEQLKKIKPMLTKDVSVATLVSAAASSSPAHTSGAVGSATVASAASASSASSAAAQAASAAQLPLAAVPAPK